MLLLGGAMPHEVGLEGLNAENLTRWRSWYRRLDRPVLFDLATKAWTEENACVALPDSGSADSVSEHVAEVFLRSHMAAAFVPTRRSVVVYGGSRYFTGEYFNDLLELHLPSDSFAPAVVHAAQVHGSLHTSVLGPGRALAEATGEVAADFDGQGGLPRFLRRARGQVRRLLTRGLVGRLRAMVRDGLLQEDDFRRILQGI